MLVITASGPLTDIGMEEEFKFGRMALSTKGSGLKTEPMVPVD